MPPFEVWSKPRFFLEDPLTETKAEGFVFSPTKLSVSALEAFSDPNSPGAQALNYQQMFGDRVIRSQDPWADTTPTETARGGSRSRLEKSQNAADPWGNSAAPRNETTSVTKNATQGLREVFRGLIAFFGELAHRWRTAKYPPFLLMGLGFLLTEDNPFSFFSENPNDTKIPIPAAGEPVVIGEPENPQAGFRLYIDGNQLQLQPTEARGKFNIWILEGETLEDTTERVVQFPTTETLREGNLFFFSIAPPGAGPLGPESLTRDFLKDHHTQVYRVEKDNNDSGNWSVLKLASVDIPDEIFSRRLFQAWRELEKAEATLQGSWSPDYYTAFEASFGEDGDEYNNVDDLFRGKKQDRNRVLQSLLRLEKIRGMDPSNFGTSLSLLINEGGFSPVQALELIETLLQNLPPNILAKPDVTNHYLTTLADFTISLDGFPISADLRYECTLLLIKFYNVAVDKQFQDLTKKPIWKRKGHTSEELVTILINELKKQLAGSK